MKSIRFEVSDELFRLLNVKLAQEGRQKKDVFLTLTEEYVHGDGEEKTDEPKKRSQKSKSQA